MAKHKFLCVAILLLKLAIGALALTLALVSETHRIVLGLLVGFEWIASVLVLYAIFSKRRKQYWYYVHWITEAITTIVFLEWLNTILLASSRPSSFLEKRLQVVLSTLAVVSKLLVTTIIENPHCYDEQTSPDENHVSPSATVNPAFDTLNMIPPFNTGSFKTNYSVQSKIDSSSLSQSSDGSPHLVSNPMNNQVVLLPYQQDNTQFIMTTPTFESKFSTQDTETRIRMLNIPEIANSPKTVTDQPAKPEVNNETPFQLYTKSNLDTIKSLENNQSDTPIHNRYKNNDNSNDLDTSSHDDLFFESLTREIIDNTKIKHQASAPNLKNPSNDVKTHSVRHSWSHSHLNLKMTTNIPNHIRSSSHSPIKKLSRTFKDSISISISSSSNNLNNNYNPNHNSSNFLTDDDNHLQSNFELNMDLVKSIQRSPKKKSSMRSLNHNTFPSIGEPLCFSPSMIPKNFEFDEKNRVVSSNSIPDGYYSLYDREKWQAIKNRS